MFFRAIKGEGAFLNDEPIKVSGVKRKYFENHKFIFKTKYFLIVMFFLELTDALVAIEFGSVRTQEFRSIVNHNINYLVTNAHGQILNIFPTNNSSFKSLNKNCFSVRSAGSAAWNLAQVARGAIDLYVEMGLHAWDMAAGDIIVREAGGIVIDPAGN